MSRSVRKREDLTPVFGLPTKTTLVVVRMKRTGSLHKKSVRCSITPYNRNKNIISQIYLCNHWARNQCCRDVQNSLHLEDETNNSLPNAHPSVHHNLLLHETMMLEGTRYHLLVQYSRRQWHPKSWDNFP